MYHIIPLFPPFNWKRWKLNDVVFSPTCVLSTLKPQPLTHNMTNCLFLCLSVSFSHTIAEMAATSLKPSVSLPPAQHRPKSSDFRRSFYSPSLRFWSPVSPHTMVRPPSDHRLPPKWSRSLLSLLRRRLISTPKFSKRRRSLLLATTRYSHNFSKRKKKFYISFIRVTVSFKWIYILFKLFLFAVYCERRERLVSFVARCFQGD